MGAYILSGDVADPVAVATPAANTVIVPIEAATIAPDNLTAQDSAKKKALEDAKKKALDDAKNGGSGNGSTFLVAAAAIGIGAYLWQKDKKKKASGTAG